MVNNHDCLLHIVVGHDCIRSNEGLKLTRKRNWSYCEKTRKVQSSIDQLPTKLANEGLSAKAPAAVVEGEKVKLAEFADQLSED